MPKNVSQEIPNFSKVISMNPCICPSIMISLCQDAGYWCIATTRTSWLSSEFLIQWCGVSYSIRNQTWTFNKTLRIKLNMHKLDWKASAFKCHHCLKSSLFSYIDIMLIKCILIFEMWHLPLRKLGRTLLCRARTVGYSGWSSARAGLFCVSGVMSAYYLTFAVVVTPHSCPPFKQSDLTQSCHTCDVGLRPNVLVRGANDYYTPIM